MITKILSVATLLAATTSLANAATVLSQTFTKSDGTTSSLWDTVKGKKSATEQSSSSIDGLILNRFSGGMTTITGSSDSSVSSITTTLSGLYGYSADDFANTAFQVESFSLLSAGFVDSGKSGSLGNSTQGTITITGTYNGNSVSYTSSSPNDSACYEGTTAKSTYEARVYSFSDAKFDAGSSLTISGSGYFGYAVVKTSGSSSISPETNPTASSNWNSVFSLSVSSVPEPSAFGLIAGLGAIALAVSHRRRSR